MPATEFTPLASTIGGMLIGAAAVIMLALNGRIAGISGIVGRLLPPYANSDPVGAAWFIVGLIAAPLIYEAAAGAPFAQIVSGNVALMAIAGVLVGFGTGIGGGCTSGHGVCGVARLSLRSILATATFMATGFITVFLMRHAVGG
jgi:uncharacterized membrane protein YedE/YeeE